MAYHINASSDRYATTVMAKDGQYGSGSEKPENGEDVVDRRDGLDRRTINDSTADLDRRRGPGRRRSDFLRAAEEGELSKEQFMFLMAIHAFKEANERDRKSTRLNSSHVVISYAVFCLKKKKK